VAADAYSDGCCDATKAGALSDVLGASASAQGGRWWETARAL
jgi:hypothetical protein